MNTGKLRGIMAEKGYSGRDIAQILGISEKTFYSKMKRGVFGTDEAAKMVSVLDIEDPAAIFFDKQVT